MSLILENPMLMHKTKIDIPEEERRELIGFLNDALAHLIDLKLQVKQAHWNVKGMRFIALHELFDQVSTAVLVHIDDIAERVTSLGGTALGKLHIGDIDTPGSLGALTLDGNRGRGDLRQHQSGDQRGNGHMQLSTFWAFLSSG